jgi:hypothetical protein
MSPGSRFPHDPGNCAQRGVRVPVLLRYGVRARASRVYPQVRTQTWCARDTVEPSAQHGRAGTPRPQKGEGTAKVGRVCGPSPRRATSPASAAGHRKGRTVVPPGSVVSRPVRPAARREDVVDEAAKGSGSRGPAEPAGPAAGPRSRCAHRRCHASARDPGSGIRDPESPVHRFTGSPVHRFSKVRTVPVSRTSPGYTRPLSRAARHPGARAGRGGVFGPGALPAPPGTAVSRGRRVLRDDPAAFIRAGPPLTDRARVDDPLAAAASGPAGLVRTIAPGPTLRRVVGRHAERGRAPVPARMYRPAAVVRRGHRRDRRGGRGPGTAEPTGPSAPPGEPVHVPYG